MAGSSDDTDGTEESAKRRVEQEANRLKNDVGSLGQSPKEWVEIQAREQPLQTVAVALAIGWLVGKRL